MKITEVKIRKLIDEGRVKAVVSIVLDDAFAIHDIKVIERKDDLSLFLAMPYRRNSMGKLLDIAHPLNAQIRQQLEDAVLKAYAKAREEAANAAPETEPGPEPEAEPDHENPAD